MYSVLGIDFPIAIYVKCVFYQSIQLPARDIAQQTDYILGVDPAVVVQIPRRIGIYRNASVDIDNRHTVVILIIIDIHPVYVISELPLIIADRDRIAAQFCRVLDLERQRHKRTGKGVVFSSFDPFEHIRQIGKLL